MTISLEQKQRVLENLGVQDLNVAEFDEYAAQIQALLDDAGYEYTEEGVELADYAFVGLLWIEGVLR